MHVTKVARASPFGVIATSVANPARWRMPTIVPEAVSTNVRMS